MEVTMFFSKQSNIHNSFQYSVCTQHRHRLQNHFPLQHTFLASHSDSSPTPPPTQPVAAHWHQHPGHTAILKHSHESLRLVRVKQSGMLQKPTHCLHIITSALILDRKFSPGSMIHRPALLHLRLQCSHRRRNVQTCSSLSSEQRVCPGPAAGDKQTCFQHLQASRTIALLSFYI